jgi:hypothetical protein
VIGRLGESTAASFDADGRLHLKASAAEDDSVSCCWSSAF